VRHHARSRPLHSEMMAPTEDMFFRMEGRHARATRVSRPSVVAATYPGTASANAGAGPYRPSTMDFTSDNVLPFQETSGVGRRSLHVPPTKRATPRPTFTPGIADPGDAAGREWKTDKLHRPRD
jgi:hypothetical protein